MSSKNQMLFVILVRIRSLGNQSDNASRMLNKSSTRMLWLLLYLRLILNFTILFTLYSTHILL